MLNSDKAMPYYIYRITQGPTALVKQLEKLEEHEVYKDARNRARELRTGLGADDRQNIKVMYAATELEAEEQLMEKREAPILREWEK